MFNYLTSTIMGLVITSSPLFIAGGYYLKQYADTGAATAGLAAAAFFVSANLLYARLLAFGLSNGFLASSIGCAVGTMLVSVFLYGEAFDFKKGVALVGFIISAVALALPEAAAG